VFPTGPRSFTDAAAQLAELYGAREGRVGARPRGIARGDTVSAVLANTRDARMPLRRADTGGVSTINTRLDAPSSPFSSITARPRWDRRPRVLQVTKEALALAKVKPL